MSGSTCNYINYRNASETTVVQLSIKLIIVVNTIDEIKKKKSSRIIVIILRLNARIFQRSYHHCREQTNLVEEEEEEEENDLLGQKKIDRSAWISRREFFETTQQYTTTRYLGTIGPTGIFVAIKSQQRPLHSNICYSCKVNLFFFSFFF